MEQSIYTRVSKSIGLQGEPIDLPTLQDAEALYKGVTEYSTEAFKTVFKLYRFGKSPENHAQQEVAALISDAFNCGSRIFRQLYE